MPTKTICTRHEKVECAQTMPHNTPDFYTRSGPCAHTVTALTHGCVSAVAPEHPMLAATAIQPRATYAIE